jgi:hypothetical protein
MYDTPSATHVPRIHWKSSRYESAFALFLGAFAKLRKATISFVTSVFPSVCPHGTARLPLVGLSEVWYLRFFFFENLSRKLKFHSTLTRMMCILHKDHWTFLIICCSFLRMIRVSDKSGRESKTHVLCSVTFLKIVPFMRQCRRIPYSQAGHRWPYGACVLHAG